jgi:hemoglobin/transferrin/lactoferrin receptor protein
MAVSSVDDSSTRSITVGPRGASTRKNFSKAALALTASAAALTFSGAAVAQETQLPGIDVEGAQAKKSTAAKKKSQAAPVQQSADSPTPPPTAGEGGNQAGLIDAPYNTPAAVSVAGQSEIQTFGQNNVQNVLRAMPGVSTGDDPNNPGIAVNIRGFEGSGQVNMTIDGVRQNFGITGHTASGFAYVDPLLLASIQVQRGAVSTAGGAGAIAGTADLRTIDVDDVLKPGSNYGATILSSWGSNGVGFAEMGAGAVRSGAVSVIGAISKHNVEDYDNGLGQRVPYTDQDLISGLAKLHIQIDPEQRLSFGTVLYNNDFTANSYDQNIDSKIYTARYAYDPIGNDLVHFQADFSGNDLTMKYNDGIDGASAAAGREIDNLGLGFTVQNTSLFDIGGIHVKSNYGYEYFHNNVDASNRFDPSAEGGVNPSGNSTIRGAFSQTTFSKNIFDFIVGMRYDDYNLNGQGVVDPHRPPYIPPFVPITLPPGVELGPFAIDNDFGGFSPTLTLQAKPAEWFQPYVKWSNSFSAPSLNQTLLDGSHPGSAFEPNFLPNPFLRPETQQGWEFGFNSKYANVFQRGDTFRFKGDYYSMDVSDYITAACTSTGVPYCTYVNNAGISKVEGVELEGTYDAGYVFAGLSYSHNHTDLPSQMDGLGLHSYLPGDVATITGGLRFFDERLTVGARAYLTSESQKGEVNVSTGDPLFYEGYTTYDLFSSYKVTDDIDVSLNVTNLTDVAYTPALSAPATGDAPVDTGRGRTFLLTTKARF